MKKLHYHLITRWRFDASAHQVWSLIYDAESIARKWPGIRRFEILNMELGLRPGCRVDASVKTLPGSLDFVVEVIEVEPGRRLGLSCHGDLEGGGSWRVDELDGGAWGEFRWDVATTQWFMNILGLFLKPWLVRSHEKTMERGYRVISERLKTTAAQAVPSNLDTRASSG